MQEIKELFESIGKGDVDLGCDDLLASAQIDSLDIIALVAAMQKKYEKTMDAKYIIASNFKNTKTLQDTINKAFKG